MIHLLAIVTTCRGQRAALRKTFNGVVPQVREQILPRVFL